MNRLSLELKIIFSVILFTLFIVEFQRYLLSQETFEQFSGSKLSKNKLLINTVSPVVTLNLSLGLEEANRDYLDNIGAQNPEILRIGIVDAGGDTVYTYAKTAERIDPRARNALNYSDRELNDTLTAARLGTIQIDYSDQDLRTMRASYREATLKILLLTVIAITLFLIFLKREFKYLKRLSEQVLSYDPAEHNFPISSSARADEVGIIQNAIFKMINRNNAYAELLDETNKNLEAKVAERTKELEIANRKLEQLSVTDALTGLPNRRSFDQHYDNVWELAKRKAMPIAIILCDIDRFKDVNDTYGHLIGDIVLKAVARIFEETLKRSSDFVARYGGEEFIIILPDADAAQAQAFCEEIQTQMKQLRIDVDSQTVLQNLTFSFGISAVIPAEDVLPKYVIKQADDALYLAKESGRNAIRCYHGPFCA